MATGTLTDELNALETLMAHVNTLIIDRVARTVQTLKGDDLEEAHSIIRGDREVDEMCAQIEDTAFSVLVTHQPLGRSRLRYLTSLLSLTVDLERIADEAQEIARYMSKMSAISTASILEPDEDQKRNGGNVSVMQAMHHEIVILGQDILSIVQATMKAYTQRDQDAARFIWNQDCQIDRFATRVRDTILEQLEGTTAQKLFAQDGHEVQLLTILLGITYRLERIADHCTNICERIVFLIEGNVDMTSLLNE